MSDADPPSQDGGRRLERADGEPGRAVTAEQRGAELGRRVTRSISAARPFEFVRRGLSPNRSNGNGRLTSSDGG